MKFLPNREPDFVTVRLTDPLLFQCPYLHMEDVGTARWSNREAEALRQYLLKGGFIWVDDYWGEAAWDQWVEEISQVLPANEYPIRDLPLDHAIFHAQFEVKEVPQIPAIQHWRGDPDTTSERGAESATPDMRAIFDKHGNIMVLMTHDTDISDAFEREGEDVRYFYAFSPLGYAVGINAMLYTMSH